MSPKLYFDAVLYLNTIYTIYISVSIIYFFVKKDNSTIHDKLLKTSVDSI